MAIHDWTRVIPGIWHHFHHEWISAIARRLNADLLPGEYYALAEQVAGGLGPDVLTLGTEPPSTPDIDNGGTALLTAPPKVRFTAELELSRIRSKHIAIKHRSHDKVVAVIEIVSPGKKDSDAAISSFVKKAAELLHEGIQLLVLDLFPPGPRDEQGIHGAIWRYIVDDSFELPKDEPLTLASYATGRGINAFIEPTAVGKGLPDMPLFLTFNGHVPVPLQQTYDAAFEGVPQRWRDELE